MQVKAHYPQKSLKNITCKLEKRPLLKIRELGRKIFIYLKLLKVQYNGFIYLFLQKIRNFRDLKKFEKKMKYDVKE